MIARLVGYLGYALTLASFIYLYSVFREQYASLPADWFARYATPWFALAVLFFVSSVFSGFMIWFMQIRFEKIRLSFFPALHIFFISQIGKYLPGNIAQHIGRVALANRNGMPATTTTRFIVVEMVVVTSAAALFIALLCRFDGELRHKMLTAMTFGTVSWQLIILLMAAAALAIYMVLARLKQVRSTSLFQSLQPQRLAVLVALGLMCFVTLGLSFQSLLVGTLQLKDPGFFTCLVWITTSWLISFFTPGAPAGLGIREFILVSLLSGDYGQAAALEAALAFRAVSIVGDIVVFLTGVLTGFIRPAPAEAEVPSHGAKLHH